MKSLYKEYLFNLGYFVEEPDESKYAAEALLALADKFGIEIVSGEEKAGLSMIRLADKVMGTNIPAPFYKGFPKSVLKMSSAKLYLDQIYSYIITYGLGKFDRPRHSLFEKPEVRKILSEKTEVKQFRIITEEEAVTRLWQVAENLTKSSRPLNDTNYQILLEMIREYGFVVGACPCKDTIISLLIDTRDPGYAAMMKLSDVTKLADELQHRITPGKERHLTLPNKDRKLIKSVIDYIFMNACGDGQASGQNDSASSGRINSKANVIDCFEKKKQWAGLLHHIHYKPVNEAAADFARGMRGDKNLSVYSEFEQAMAERNIQGAVNVLVKKKGGAAFLRNIIYILSRCATDEEVDFVINSIDSKNKIVLLQLLRMLTTYTPHEMRSFSFTRFNKLCVHTEMQTKAQRRAAIEPDALARAEARVRSLLQDACKDTLGKVYIDPAMKRTALPLQENASMGGAGVLPKGSRLVLPEGKKIRAFVYWEKVDDIDLSAHAIFPDREAEEFSWRAMSGRQSRAITYSGDQTSGYDGGSEYFDVDIDRFRELYPDADYIIFCSSVFSLVPYSKCFCKAGYMLRDIEDSGKVFEPRTVESSFRVTSEGTLAYTFAIDLIRREFVWLNVGRQGNFAIAGEDDQRFVRKYLDLTDTINVYDYASMLATEIVDDPGKADVVFSDREFSVDAAGGADMDSADGADGGVDGDASVAGTRLKEGAEQIRSMDIDKLIALMN